MMYIFNFIIEYFTLTLLQVSFSSLYFCLYILLYTDYFFSQ